MFEQAPLLGVANLQRRFGGLTAVSDVTFALAPGTITGLIGPNGAGKTTLFNLLVGALRPDRGQVYLNGSDITGMPPHRVFHQGLARTFQLTRPFAELSVLDNLLVAPRGQLGERFWANWLRRGKVARQEQALREQAAQVLELLTLTPLAQQPAKTLSGGQRKLLDIGRALMAKPTLLLLDEPGAGVNRALLDTIIDRLALLNRDYRLSLFIIEHNMELVSRLCQQVLVMADGCLLTQGSADEVRRDPQVIDAYLGDDLNDALTNNAPPA